MRVSWLLVSLCLPLFALAQETLPATSQPASQPTSLLLDEAPLTRQDPPLAPNPLPAPPLRRAPAPTIPVPQGRSDVYGLFKLQGNFLLFYLNAGAEASLGYCLPSRPGSALFPAGIGVEASARVGRSSYFGGSAASFAGGDLSVRFFTPLERGRFGGSGRLGLGLESLLLNEFLQGGVANPHEPSLAVYGVVAKDYYVLLFHHVTLNYGGTLLAAYSLQPQPRSFLLFPTLNLGLGLVF